VKLLPLLSRVAVSAFFVILRFAVYSTGDSHIYGKGCRKERCSWVSVGKIARVARGGKGVGVVSLCENNNSTQMLQKAR
jgi:hypothetical protein